MSKKSLQVAWQTTFIRRENAAAEKLMVKALSLSKKHLKFERDSGIIGRYV